MFALAAASASMAIPVCYEGPGARFASFMVFETCVGVYWPAISTMKGRIVPEPVRACIYNMYVRVWDYCISV